MESMLRITSESITLEFSTLNPNKYNVRLLLCPLLSLPYITDSTAMLEGFQLPPARCGDNINIVTLNQNPVSITENSI